MLPGHREPWPQVRSTSCWGNARPHRRVALVPTCVCVCGRCVWGRRSTCCASAVGEQLRYDVSVCALRNLCTFPSPKTCRNDTRRNDDKGAQRVARRGCLWKRAFSHWGRPEGNHGKPWFWQKWQLHGPVAFKRFCHTSCAAIPGFSRFFPSFGTQRARACARVASIPRWPRHRPHSQ